MYNGMAMVDQNKFNKLSVVVQEIQVTTNHDVHYVVCASRSDAHRNTALAHAVAVAPL